MENNSTNMSEFDDAVQLQEEWVPNWVKVSAVEPQPKKLVTARITGLGDLKETGKEGNGDYYTFDILVEPTRGSNPTPRPALMFRAEMFSTKFNSEKHYGKAVKGGAFQAVPPYNFIPKNKRKQTTQAESFSHVCRLNTIPTKFKEIRKQIVQPYGSQTPLSSIFGGDMDAINHIIAMFRTINNPAMYTQETGDLGISGPTAESVYEYLNAYIAGSNQVEQVYELSQRKDADGELTDFYQVSQYYGPLTSELYSYLQSRAASTSEKETSEQIKLRFRV